MSVFWFIHGYPHMVVTKSLLPVQVRHLQLIPPAVSVIRDQFRESSRDYDFSLKVYSSSNLWC